MLYQAVYYIIVSKGCLLYSRYAHAAFHQYKTFCFPSVPSSFSLPLPLPLSQQKEKKSAWRDRVSLLLLLRW